MAAAIPTESKLNVLLTAGGRRVVKAQDLDLSRSGAPVRVATRPWAPSPWLPGRVKHTSRLAWVLAARQAAEAVTVARLIDRALKNKDDAAGLAAIRAEAQARCGKFPIYR